MILGFSKTFIINGTRKQTKFVDKIRKGVKIHSIRLDKSNRWKQGNLIHMATGVRSPNYYCFMTEVCTLVQRMHINPADKTIELSGVNLHNIEIEQLAINDGFDSVGDFWSWFESYEPADVKLIHWTDYRYTPIDTVI